MTSLCAEVNIVARILFRSSNFFALAAIKKPNNPNSAGSTTSGFASQDSQCVYRQTTSAVPNETNLKDRVTLHGFALRSGELLQLNNAYWRCAGISQSS